MKEVIRIGLIAVLLLGWTRGQDLKISFDRQNNFTYSTQSLLSYRLKKENYRIQVIWDQDLILNTNRNPSSLVLFNIRAQVWQHHRVGDSLEISSFTEVEQFWTTQNQRYSQYFGLNYRWKTWLSLTPMLGYSWDYRSARLDQGFSPALSLRSRHRFKDGTFMENRLWSRLKYIAPRHQRNLSFSSNWNKSLGEDARIAWGVEMGSNQMDDYRLSSVEQIESDTAAAFLSLRYRVAPRLTWTSDNRLIFNRRLFDYEVFEIEEPEFNDLRFNQRQLFSLQQLDMVREKWSFQGQYIYEFLERNYQLDNDLDLPQREFDRRTRREKQKDAFRRTHSFNLNAAYIPNDKHRLSLEANNKYIQYDTPSEDNFDDHDELTYGLRLGWKARWDSKFSTQYALTGGLRRYAFLFGERSQDNYTQRNLRLDFSYNWFPLKKLRLFGEQRIYVTYNVKDFTDKNLTDRSTRNLETRLGADYLWSQKWRSRFRFYCKEIQVSYLNWAAFSETGLDTTTTLRVEMSHSYVHGLGQGPYRLRYDFGYRHAGRFRFLNSSMTSLENVLTPINLHIRTQQTGPSTGIELMGRQGSLFELDLWWQWQIQDFVYDEVSRFSTLSSNYQEEQLRRVDLSFRPFIRLRLNLWLGA